MIKNKPFSSSDVARLHLFVEGLSRVAGVQSCYAPRSQSDLSVMGGAICFLKIDATTADKIWRLQDLSTDAPGSAYASIMASQDIDLSFTVWKTGGLLSRTYFANLTLDDVERRRGVPIGSVAAKSIPGLIMQIDELLRGHAAVPDSTEDALRRATT